MTMTAFAEIAGVTLAAISTAARPGNRLHVTKVGRKINAAHPEARAYIANNRSTAPKRGPRVREPRPPVDTTEITLPPATMSQTSPEFLNQIPDDVREMADKSLNELVSMFGTSKAFKDWASATKTLEDIFKKRLDNAETEGRLVTRDLVRQVFVDPLTELFSRLLNDGAKTITSLVITMHDAGRTDTECLTAVQDQMSAFIRPAKQRIENAICRSE